ncbi:cytochrome P450 [Schizopora paradoxa]|uniref:Cytochrome P450 n=1 Tax=Schizopora paradoxa TaxID=27342 RepID=A0A0H2RFA8_9AGAM|nr:cytochrome P450 [Schizopora paradoxa]
MQLYVLELICIPLATWLVHKLVVKRLRNAYKSTSLAGPPSTSLLFGIRASDGLLRGDPNKMYEKWEKEYGSAFQVPGPFWTKQYVLLDPKALAHVFSRTPFGYTRPGAQMFLRIFGQGLLSAEGETHKRQRKALTPAFSNAAIRSLTSIFFDSAYKLKDVWDSEVQSSDANGAVIDVQQWMNKTSLDSIGLAGFGHDFHALDGERSEVQKVFDSFALAPAVGKFNGVITFIVTFLPGGLFMRLPLKRVKLFTRLAARIREVSEELWRKSKVEGGNDEKENKVRSAIGTLLKAESASTEWKIDVDEINELILAGYETTSITMTWALIELSRHPEKQERLRKELMESFSARDPTHDDFTSGLHYLDSVLRETLRLHPPVTQLIRTAEEDDILPLSMPLKNASGMPLNSISIPKGGQVVVPIRALNTSPTLWGPDALEFKPERWMDDESGLTEAARAIQGYHHLFTFGDGPRICIGRAFAGAEFKAVLSVLLRNYIFELRDGPQTPIETIMTILPRPKVAGEKGYAVPLRVRSTTST